MCLGVVVVARESARGTQWAAVRIDFRYSPSFETAMERALMVAGHGTQHMIR